MLRILVGEIRVFSANHLLMQLFTWAYAYYLLLRLRSNHTSQIGHFHGWDFLHIISPPTMSSKACHTNSTPSSRLIMKRVMRGSVMGSTPLSLMDMKKGITEPREPMTLP